jgi:hypothetical protein
MANVSTGGEAAPAGEVQARRILVADHERRVRSLLGAISLGPDVREWVSARFEDGNLRLTIHATGADGTVTAMVEIEPDRDLRAAFRDTLNGNRDRAHDALKRAIANTMAAELLSGGG